jgi:phosphatidylinositol kinase/protein kinase (PI-3  family)
MRRGKRCVKQKRFFELGGEPSHLDRIIPAHECQKHSENTKRMCANGKFSYGDGSVMRSKLEKRIYDQALTVFPDAQHSRWLTVNDTTYVFDIFIPSIKTFIEVNGNYWHLNSRIYEATHTTTHTVM